MATTKTGPSDSNTKRKKTSAKPLMKVGKSPKKSATKSSKSTSSNKKPNNDKKVEKVVSKKTSPKKTTKAGTKKTKNNVKSGDKSNTSPKKTKPKVDYKTRHHIGRRKATENVISYSQSGTTFFDLYTDYKTFNISSMKFPTKRGHDDSNSAKLPAKKLKLDPSSVNSGKVASPMKDKENSAASKEKKNIEKLKKSKGLKIQSLKKNKEIPSKKATEKSKLQKKKAITDMKMEGANKAIKPSPKKKKVVSSCQDVAPRGPWVRRQASLNASAVMTVLYERERVAAVDKEADGRKTPVKSPESSNHSVTSKDTKKVSKTPKLTSKKTKESTKKGRVDPKNKVSRTNKKSGKVQKVVTKSKATCKSKKVKGPYRFRELKNLLDCDNNDLDCDVLKSIQQGFFSKGTKRKINSSDIQLGVFAHKKREASLNAQAMLAASCGRIGARRIGRDYSSSETSSDSEFFQSDSDEADECSSVTSSEVEADDDSDEIIDVVENDDDEDMRAARVLPDAFKITRHVTTVHHTHEILGHWVDGLGIKESLMCKDSIQWTNRELLETQPQVTPVSPGNGIIVPVSQVQSPRMEVIKVAPRPSLQTPPLQSSPMQSSSLLINGMVTPGGSPLPNGIIGAGVSPLPTSYSYNNGAIIPTSHCQSFTLNGLGSISLMATYPNRYDSAFRVPSFNSSYYQHPGCYSQNSPIMQPVQGRYTHIVHHPIPVQPQQDLEIIFHHHNSHQTIKPCCSKTETVTCTVTHTQQQHVNQKQPCQIQESFPPAPTPHQPLPPLPPTEPSAPQQFSSQQLAPQQFSSQQMAPQNFPSQQTGPQQYPTQQSAPQHFQQQVAPQQYPHQQTQHQYPQQQVPQQYPSLSAPQQFSHQQSGPRHFQHQKSTQQFSQYTSSMQQFPHQGSVPQQFRAPPQSGHNPYPGQQSHMMQNPAVPSNQTLPANNCSLPVNKSLPPSSPRYHTLTAPPPQNTPDSFRRNVSEPQLKSLSAPQNQNSAAPQVINLSMPQISASHSGANLPAQPTHNAALPQAQPRFASKNASSLPKQPALHPIPKPYTHPMPQTVPRPIGPSERGLRKRPRSVTSVSSDGRKRMCLNPVTVEIPMEIQVYGVDKNDAERSCHRRKERTEPAAREPKKRFEENEGFVEKCGSDLKKDSIRVQSVERRKPERLSPRLSKEKPGPDVNRLLVEQPAISPKEKSVTDKTKQKVAEKTKHGGMKEKVKSKPVLNNNNKAVANNNKKAVGEKTKLINSKKCLNSKAKLLGNKKKVGGQRLVGDKKVLKSVTKRPKLSLKKSAQQQPKLLKKKTATGQKAKLLKSSDQRPKHLNLKKSVAVGKGPKHCKTSPTDKPKTNIKKSSVERRRVDAKQKAGKVKAGQAGSISSRRGSNRKQSLDNSWQWVGEPETKLVYTCNEMPGVERSCYSAICHNDGDIIRVRDCVLLRSGPRKKDLPFIAKIAAFFEKEGEKMMSILWYYRPEHTEAGRQPNHLPAELFASKHKDENSIACIEDKCLVMSVGKYCRYRAKLKLLEENLPLSYSKQTLVPKADDVPTECLPTDVDPETVFLCRSVYDFRQKRILKNPS